MIVLPDRIRDATIVALETLAKRQDIPQDVAIELQIAAGVLGYARHLTDSGAPTIQKHCAEVVALLRDLPDGMANEQRQVVTHLQTEARALASAQVDVNELHRRFAKLLSGLDQLLIDFARHAPASSQALPAKIAAPLMEWQVSLNALSQVPPNRNEVAARDNTVEKQNMQTLLRVRMKDAGLIISEWTVLPGGFGKETCLFKVDGGEINAELVMRRDIDASLIKGVDCHEVKQEYPLLKAIFDLGFPVPEPLFVETDSTIVGGPDFMIMRRVIGKVEGDVLGGTGKVAPIIQRQLAQVTARLHLLPPQRQLGEGTPEFAPALWDMTTADCTRHYINAWYGMYLAKSHMAIPAVHSMFNWLLTNVPDSDDQTTVVHGDIGLHNLLFHDGELASVLDWEFAHIGDPAEDLGIIYTVMREQLDWNIFLDVYAQAGRTMPSMRRIRYYEIWMNFRNLCIASICLEQFASGHLKQIRYGVFATRFVPHYIERVTTLIREWRA